MYTLTTISLIALVVLSMGFGAVVGFALGLEGRVRYPTILTASIVYMLGGSLILIVGG